MISFPIGVTRCDQMFSISVTASFLPLFLRAGAPVVGCHLIRTETASCLLVLDDTLIPNITSNSIIFRCS